MKKIIFLFCYYLFFVKINSSTSNLNEFKLNTNDIKFLNKLIEENAEKKEQISWESIKQYFTISEEIRTLEKKILISKDKEKENEIILQNKKSVLKKLETLISDNGFIDKFKIQNNIFKQLSFYQKWKYKSFKEWCEMLIESPESKFCGIFGFCTGAILVYLIKKN